MAGRKVGRRGESTPADGKAWPQGKVWTLAVDRKRYLAARLDGAEGRHPPTERLGRKARHRRWQLTGSVAWPQGWIAWKADTRRQKGLAARRGVDVGSWPSVLPDRKVGRTFEGQQVLFQNQPTGGGVIGTVSLCAVLDGGKRSAAGVAKVRLVRSVAQALSNGLPAVRAGRPGRDVSTWGLDPAVEL